MQPSRNWSTPGSELPRVAALLLSACVQARCGQLGVLLCVYFNSFCVKACSFVRCCYSLAGMMHSVVSTEEARLQNLSPDFKLLEQRCVWIWIFGLVRYRHKSQTQDLVLISNPPAEV